MISHVSRVLAIISLCPILVCKVRCRIRCATRLCHLPWRHHRTPTHGTHRDMVLCTRIIMISNNNERKRKHFTFVSYWFGKRSDCSMQCTPEPTLCLRRGSISCKDFSQLFSTEAFIWIKRTQKWFVLCGNDSDPADEASNLWSRSRCRCCTSTWNILSSSLMKWCK